MAVSSISAPNSENVTVYNVTTDLNGVEISRERVTPKGESVFKSLFEIPEIIKTLLYALVTFIIAMLAIIYLALYIGQRL